MKRIPLGEWRARRAAARSAGGSAEERFREGLAAYRRLVRPFTFSLAAVFIGGGVVLALLAGGYWVFFGGLLAGFGLTCFMWVDDSPPAYIENWRDGYEGERKTAKELATIGAHWRVFHDLPTSEDANRDHLALGPAGLFLIDSKNLNGEAEVTGDQLTITRRVAGFGYSRPLGRWARRSAWRLHQDLKAEFGEAPRVQAVLTLWCRFRAEVVEGDRVAFVHGEALARWLKGKPRVFDDEALAVWTVRLERFAEAARAEAASRDL